MGTSGVPLIFPPVLLRTIVYNKNRKIHLPIAFSRDQKAENKNYSENKNTKWKWKACFWKPIEVAVAFVLLAHITSVELVGSCSAKKVDKQGHWIGWVVLP